MNRFRYLVKECIFRRGRSIVTTASIGLSVLAAVLLIGIATSYSQAIQAPMKSVGADVVVQLSGDIPSKLEGLVFPHPNAMLPREKIERIREIPGVVSLTRAVYLWELAPNPYKSVLGIEGGKAGLGGLNANLISGKKISAGDRAVLIDSVLFLSERMGLILALVIGIFSIAFVLRATASAVNERHREMALLQAIGWSWSRIRNQVVLENTALALIGSTLGLALPFPHKSAGVYTPTQQVPLTKGLKNRVPPPHYLMPWRWVIFGPEVPTERSYQLYGLS